MTDAFRSEQTDVRVRAFVQQVYGWMAAALAVTGFVALAVSRSDALQRLIFGSQFVFFGLLTMGAIFLAYTQATVAQAFFVTAGLFMVMTLYGFFTNADLTRLGNLLGMALLGFIIATVVNLFLRSEGLYWLITYAGVLIFVGLIAYDSQRIKEMALAGVGEGEEGQKHAIMGALRLYLDFVNLFLLLLRILGRRR